MSFASFTAACASVRAAGKSIVLLANPSLNYARRSAAGYPLIELDAALAVTAVYSVIVLVGLWRYFGRARDGAAAVPSSPVGGTSKKDKPKVPLREKFGKEPILYAQAAYNVAQVALCAYMIYAALAVAAEEKWGVVCNAFNGTSSKLTHVLWVFYVSKVRPAAAAAAAVVTMAQYRRATYPSAPPPNLLSPPPCPGA
jgi:Na+/H+-dicarboxylate symporter